VCVGALGVLNVALDVPFDVWSPVCSGRECVGLGPSSANEGPRQHFVATVQTWGLAELM
jgi:hypothetical protein